MGESWHPLNFTLSASDTDQATSLLLSHTAGPVRHAKVRDAAYALSLFGECAPPAQVQLLTAAAILKSRLPIFPVLALLGERCAASASLVAALRAEGTEPIAVPEVRGVKCNGPRFGPDSKRLPANATTSYFDATYTILAAWNLTQFRAVMILDSDLAVRQNLDHVLVAMLARPEIAEARTPEGCLDAVSVSPYRGNYFNTGVWAVRPDAAVFGSLVRWLQSGTREHQCGIGIQTAAKGFFSRQRIDESRFDALAHCCGGWRHNELRELEKGSWTATRAEKRGLEAAAELAAPPHSSSELAKLRPWEILRLHAGYNGKANAGIVACLHKGRDGRGPTLTENDSFVVHWSGSRKPLGLDRADTKDHLEYAAWAEYVTTYCQVYRRHAYEKVMNEPWPERKQTCSMFLANFQAHRSLRGSPHGGRTAGFRTAADTAGARRARAIGR